MADRLQILAFIILSLPLPFRLNKVNIEVKKTKDKVFFTSFKTLLFVIFLKKILDIFVFLFLLKKPSCKQNLWTYRSQLARDWLCHIIWKYPLFWLLLCVNFWLFCHFHSPGKFFTLHTDFSSKSQQKLTFSMVEFMWGWRGAHVYHVCVSIHACPVCMWVHMKHGVIGVIHMHVIWGRVHMNVKRGMYMCHW